jgi:hypothetical protein
MKYLQGLTIEFILVSKYKDAALKMGVTEADEPFWSISEPVIKCQTVTLDNSLENEFTSRLLNGKSFPIAFTSCVTQIANAGNTPSPVVSITRAFTRLKAAYITLYKRMFRYDTTDEATEEQKYHTLEVEHMGHFKEATFFYHPQCVYNGRDNAATIEKDKKCRRQEYHGDFRCNCASCIRCTKAL